MTAGVPRPPDDVTELRVQLRSATGDVDRGNRAPLEESQARVQDFRRHDLGPIRAGVDVAMMAGLVAALADVELQHTGIGRPQPIVPG